MRFPSPTGIGHGQGAFFTPPHLREGEEGREGERNPHVHDTRNDTDMDVVVVPCLKCNYAYLIRGSGGKECATVDPVEPHNVLRCAQERGWKTCRNVLTTHKHWDHAGGNEEFAKLVPGCAVYGGEKEQVEGCTDAVKDGREIHLTEVGVRVKCIETPFHTMGSISYLVTDDLTQEKAVFTGDTLFVGGCGKCFEGNVQNMWDTLIHKFSRLPPETKVYCGHEITVKNLEFCTHADPQNECAKEKLEWARNMRSQGKPTVPSTIAEELSYNVFLRPLDSNLQTWTGKTSAMETLAELRRRKDAF
eukprot:scaffold1554_cov332-Pavlova_lutheri.AAC.8